MSDEEFDRRIAGRIAFDRRAFIKKMVVGAAFAAPAVASFNMLGFGTAQGFTSNTSGCGKLQKELQGLETAYAVLPVTAKRQRAIVWSEILQVEHQMQVRGCTPP